MDWAAIILMVLKFVISFVDRINFSKKQDEALAQIAASILKKSQFAKQVMEEINGLDDKAVDDLLLRLEPDGVPKS